MIVSFLAGMATLALVYRRRFEPARYGAALAVAAVIAGGALSRWPTILPGLTVHQAAAGHDTLVGIIVVVLGGGAILFPSLALLFRLALTGRFEAQAPQLRPARVLGDRPRRARGATGANHAPRAMLTHPAKAKTKATYEPSSPPRPQRERTEQ